MTFRNKADAFTAIEQGNDDTSYPKVDLCFGGRRAFCKEKYSDLGNSKLAFVSSNHISAVCLQFFFADSRSFLTGAKSSHHMVNSSSNLDGGDTDDFDSLLKQARAGIRNKWYQEIISRKKWIIINDATILFVQISHHKKHEISNALTKHSSTRNG